MKIKFLGTGSGKTSLNRYHSSFLISSSTNSLLVDCGDGISKAILKQNIDFNSFNSILISHFHADHFAGIPSLLTQMKLGGRKNELTIFVHSSEKPFLEDFIFHSYLFKERMTFELKIISFHEDNEIKVSENLYFISKLNSHLEKYRKYDEQNKLGFVSLSFLFKDDKNTVLYSGDVGTEKDLYLFDQKADWFITETTHIKHENLLDILNKFEPSKLILTHIDDDFEEVLKTFHQSLPEELKSRIILTFDGLEINHYSSSCL